MSRRARSVRGRPVTFAVSDSRALHARQQESPRYAESSVREGRAFREPEPLNGEYSWERLCYSSSPSPRDRGNRSTRCVIVR
jgi:hypothetical protein